MVLAALVGCGGTTPENELPPANPSAPAANAGAGDAGSSGPKPSDMDPDKRPAGYPAPVGKPGEAKGDEADKKDGDADKKDGGADKKEGEADKKDDGPKVTAVTLTDDEVAEIKKLPEAEQTDALAQKICPVGFTGADPAEGHLGAMGKPLKKVVDGKTVYLCCKGCEKDFDADPKAFLAKIEQAKAAK